MTRSRSAVVSFVVSGAALVMSIPANSAGARPPCHA
jgi:hypothetical protein